MSSSSLLFSSMCHASGIAGSGFTRFGSRFVLVVGCTRSGVGASGSFSIIGLGVTAVSSFGGGNVGASWFMVLMGGGEGAYGLYLGSVEFNCQLGYGWSWSIGCIDGIGYVGGSVGC